MDENIKYALEHDFTIDITTIGRKTGQAHRIEIWFFNLGGHLYITAKPVKRLWYANLVAHPDFTFHLKESVKADLPARATPITDEAQRRVIMTGILKKLDRMDELEAFVTISPLVEVSIQGY